MSAQALAPTLGLGETILLGIVAVIMIACALCVLTAQRAVTAAVSMIGVMLGLATLYIANEAPFLGVTQVVVYTGAVMTLVMFVIMLVGVGGHEPILGAKGTPVPVVLLTGAAMVALLVALVWRSGIATVNGLGGGNNATPADLAQLLFSEHVVTMEITGTLLVVAAVGAMALTHRQRVKKAMSQADHEAARMRAYATKGIHPGQKPMPGVYASTNSAAAPALDASGQALTSSLPRPLVVRGQDLDLASASPEAAAAQRQGTATARLDATVGTSGMPSMPGAAAPRVAQPVRGARTQVDQGAQGDAEQTAAQETNQ